jgi:hypothetical protein
VKIYKYVLELTDKQTISIPAPARILSVEAQFGSIVIYAMVEPGATEVKRTFYVVGTGHSADHVNCRPFIGTVKMADGGLMFHVFTDW